TEALADDVGHAHHLEDGPHRAAGNDAVALLGRRHQHARGTVLADHLVVDRAVLQLHLDHVATRRFHGLRHRNRHFLGLALAHADAAIAVADDGERREAERAAALDDLGDAVDRDHLFLQAVVVAFALGTRLKLCHLEFLCSLADQNWRPASRAASASALTRPWYANPARSNATLSTPAAFAFSAMRLPTIAAAATLPPLPAPLLWPARSLRTSASAVEAL